LSKKKPLRFIIIFLKIKFTKSERENSRVYTESSRAVEHERESTREHERAREREHERERAREREHELARDCGERYCIHRRRQYIPLCEFNLI